MPTFCRHNRFIERCPICSKTLPGAAAGARNPRPAAAGRPAARSSRTNGGRSRGQGVRVHREDRAADDGYRCSLLPGVRASSDALRLVAEIGFSSGRLLTLATAPPDLYGQARALARVDRELATWICFVIVYLCPLQGADPFAGIRLALREDKALLEDLADIPLGPRTSYEEAHGGRTLDAYRRWVAQAGSQERAFLGDPAWGPRRRFERLFERLALPGLGRFARYELLVTLGRLGLYQLQPGSLHFSGVRAGSGGDLALEAAKRVFAIGDPLHLDRRAAALAEAVAIPVEVLDVALGNWGAGERATLGFPAETCDADARRRAAGVLRV